MPCSGGSVIQACYYPTCVLKIHELYIKGGEPQTMTKYYKMFLDTFENVAWHSERYSYSLNKLLHNLTEVKTEVDMFHNFGLLTDEEYEKLDTKTREIVSQEIIYK